MTKTPATIMIVDDDPDILEAMQLLLELEGYGVKTVANAEQIESALQKYKPNLILLDVFLSGQDGRIICRRLKNQQSTKEIPILMVSAHPSADRSSRNCGAEDFVAKPFDINVLLKKIEQHLN